MNAEVCAPKRNGQLDPRFAEYVAVGVVKSRVLSVGDRLNLRKERLDYIAQTWICVRIHVFSSDLGCLAPGRVSGSSLTH